MKNSGVSLIALVITIVIMLILLSITAVYFFTSADVVSQAELEQEIKNVEAIVSNAKIRIMTEEFTPNPDFLAIRPASEDADETYMEELGFDATTINKVIDANSNTDVAKKYYLLDATRLKSEFGDDVNISGLKRIYLVTYYDREITLAVNGEIITSGSTSIDYPDEGFNVAFSPNGNISWERSQSATLRIRGTYENAKYMWKKSIIEPEPSEFIGPSMTGDGTEVLMSIDDVTGNDYYIWVIVNYYDGGILKQQILRSNAFYLDNAEPNGTLIVE